MGGQRRTGEYRGPFRVLRKQGMRELRDTRVDRRLFGRLQRPERIEVTLVTDHVWLRRCPATGQCLGDHLFERQRRPRRQRRRGGGLPQGCPD
jgi:hypothetical protein